MRFYIFLIIGLLGGCVSTDNSGGATNDAKRKSIEVHKDHFIAGVHYSRFIDDRSAFLINGPDIENISFDPSGKLKVKFTDDEEGNYSTGSASAITEDGYFLTAAHVLLENAADNLWLVHRSNPRRLKMKARVVWLSRKLDIALVKAEMRTRFYKFGDPYRSNHFRVLIAGLEGGNASGSILEVKKIPSDSDALEVIHSAPIRRGDSGGALISKSGELLGINSKYHRNIHGYGIVVGRGYAIFPKSEGVFSKIAEDRGRVR